MMCLAVQSPNDEPYGGGSETVEGAAAHGSSLT